jgi:two-component system response regulator AlgR
MNVLIVDDEKPARERLKKMLALTTQVSDISEASSGEQALQKSQQLKPDVVLMDIRMPGMDGIEAANYINKMERAPAIIFTTAYSAHAIDAFKTHAIDYLLKPIKKIDLENALIAAQRINKAQLKKVFHVEKDSHRQSICVSFRGNLELILVTEIFYFMADNKYVTLRTAEHEYLIEEPLKALEKEFEAMFLRIHRNALVSKKHLLGLTKNKSNNFCISFSSIDDLLEISRRHLPNVRAWLQSKAKR